MATIKGFSELSDHALVQLVQVAADSGAFSELVIRYQSALFNFILKFERNPTVAEDLSQDTFIKAFMKIRSFKGESSFKTWLFSIAYREFLQEKRKAGAFMKLLQAVGIYQDSVEQPEPLISLDLDKQLSKLGKPEKTAIILCDVIGMTNLEASQIMDVPLGSLKTYVKRARALMNDAMGQSYDDRSK